MKVVLYEGSKGNVTSRTVFFNEVRTELELIFGCDVGDRLKAGEFLDEPELNVAAHAKND